MNCYLTESHPSPKLAHLSDNSGAQAATTQEKRSLADIVREKTNDGETIVQFYLDVASGKLDGFRDNHRMAAANKIGKIAPNLVAKYLVKYRNSDCRDSLRGSSLLPVRRPPIKSVSPESRETVPRGPNVFQRRLAQIVREETGDGRAIVAFVVNVMNGELTGFKPHHRLEAAHTLAAYFEQDQSLWPAKPVRAEPTVVRAEPTVVRADSKIVRPEPVEGPVRADSRIVRPEPVEGQCSAETTGPVLSPAEGPEKADSRIVRPEPVERVEAPSDAHQLETRSSELETLPTRNFPPITLEELERFDYDPSHFGRFMFARDEITGGIYAFDDLGPVVVDEDGDIHSISPDDIVGCHRVLNAYRHRDRWPAGVPRPYEDFSSNPPPAGRRRNPAKIWV